MSRTRRHWQEIRVGTFINARAKLGRQSMQKACEVSLLERNPFLLKMEWVMSNSALIIKNQGGVNVLPRVFLC